MDTEQRIGTVVALLSACESRAMSIAKKGEKLAEEVAKAAETVAATVAELKRVRREVREHPEELSAATAQRLLETTERYSEQLSATIDLCEKGKPRKRDIGELQVIAAKLNTIQEFACSAVKLPQSDLFAHSKSAPRWESLLEVAQVYSFPNPESLHRHLSKLIQTIAAGTAFVSKAYERTGTSRKLLMGAGAVYYNLSKEKALRKARISFANPSIGVAKAVWNLMDSKLMAAVVEKTSVSVKVSTVIHVPRVDQRAVAAVLREEVPSGALGEHAERANPAFERQAREGYVQIRVISPFLLPELNRHDSKCGCCGPTLAPKRPLTLKAAIFHIHGGGFISMSSRSHQNYTRRWAAALDTVIFSVDYRLAPEFPYPAALDDAWDAYLWVVGYAKRYLGVKFSQIIVTGDSAGGNLACGVLNRAVETGVAALVPSGAMLTYPALYLAPGRYTPSFELALEDMIVHHTFLRLCMQSYVPPGADPTTDYFLSPLLTPSANISRFPPVRFMLGSADPLGDDSWRLAERLKSAGKDVKIVQFDGMPHGFLGFDLKVNGVKEARATVEQGIAFLRELTEGGAS